MPSSGARSGTKPKRPTRGGDGKVGGYLLACGHEVDYLEEVAVFPGRRILYRCSKCNSMQEQEKRKR